jgi:NDP-sugar pyrophosphorylase family protein
LETIIEKFVSYGFVNITLCVNYKANIIKEYFSDGAKFKANIKYIDEDKKMGTAGALSLIKENINEPFFVMNGDLLTNLNFKNMMNFHILNQSKATMGVREYNIKIPYGVLNIKDNMIQSIKEKPKHSFFINAGVYILDSNIIKLIPRDKFYDMPTLFEKLIELNYNTLSYEIREYWLDIGQIKEYERANIEYLEVF